jgi:cytochrome c oxidase assembly protein subunit 15
MKEQAAISIETSGRATAQGPSLGLHRLAQVTAGFAFFVLFAGGMVTSTGSGLSVPDWPLSFHRFFPPMTGGVLFEHGHRMVAGTVALLIWALTFRVFREEHRRWVKAVAAVASLGVVLQAVLGGLTVLLKLPAEVSIAHACLGQTVFCLVVALAQATSPWYVAAASSNEPPGPWRWGAIAFATLFVQLVLGAVVRHTGFWIPAHMVWALVVLGGVGHAIKAGFSKRDPRPELSGPSTLLAALLPTQIGLGAFAYMIRHSDSIPLGFHASAAFVTAHLAVGALLLGTCVVWTLRARRYA